MQMPTKTYVDAFEKWQAEGIGALGIGSRTSSG